MGHAEILPLAAGRSRGFACGTAAVNSAIENANDIHLDLLLQEVAIMITRTAKLLLLAGIALFYTLVVFNNVTDFDSNYQFVRHVLMMDSTFSDNHGLWRALRSPGIHLGFYVSIIAWEIATTILLWWSAVRLLRAVRLPAATFNAAKRTAIMALTLSMLMWLVAFLSVGAEWFLMWQSRAWNGQEAAFRMFVVVGLVLLLLLQPDTDAQP
jgi:predicted small integral membrane protein